MKGLLIAKMDATTNEAVGVTLEGYPTIIYYPANNKNPLVYPLGLIKEDMVKWLKTVSSKKVDWSEYLKLEADAE